MTAKPQTDEAATLVKDPELKAMNTIARLLAGLDDRTRQRVLTWIGAKYPSNPEKEVPY